MSKLSFDDVYSLPILFFRTIKFGVLHCSVNITFDHAAVTSQPQALYPSVVLSHSLAAAAIVMKNTPKQVSERI